MNRFLYPVALVVAWLLLLPQSINAQGQNSDFTVSVGYKTKSYVGKPLAWDGEKMMLLRRNGKISILPVKSKKDYHTVDGGFEPYSRSELRSQLQREFGSKYQVSVTNNFVVVHPHGDPNVWAFPFQQLYHRFDVYFSSRGFKLVEPEFPLVAVVLKTRAEFDRFLKSYHQYDRDILGYYSPSSNRVITYDQSGGRSRDQNWFFNASTIIHEATHQTAFNTGVHSRFGPVVRWVSEGLAMLFEAPGVNNSMFYTGSKDRINRRRLISLKSFYEKDQVKGKMQQLIVSDDLFRTEPQLAYALAWGMTYYFTEKMPSKYKAFLQADGKRKNFAEFTSKQRAVVFASAFGNDWQGLEAKMARFFKKLDVPPPKKQSKY